MVRARQAVPTVCRPIPQTRRKDVRLPCSSAAQRLSATHWASEAFLVAGEIIVLFDVTSSGPWLLGMQNIDDVLLERGRLARLGQRLT